MITAETRAWNPDNVGSKTLIHIYYTDKIILDAAQTTSRKNARKFNKFSILSSQMKNA